MTDNRNTILAVILSGLVLIAWQYFYNVPQMERQRAQTKVQSELTKKNPSQAPAPGTTPSATPQAGTAPTPSAQAPAAAGGPVVSREAAIANAWSNELQAVSVH